MALESLSDPVIIGQLCEQWAHIYDTHTSVDIYQRKVEIEQFLEGFNQLSDEDRLRLDRLNRYENISSALSRQLLLLIYEICDPAVKWYAPVDATSTTVAGSSDHSSATTAPTDNVAHESECNSKLDSNSNEEQAELLLHADSSESRCQWLKDFFLNGIGGLLLRTLSKIGAKDIANSREIAAVLVRILPTTRWNTDPNSSSVELQPGYGEFLRSVLKMRTLNGDWHRESFKRNNRNRSICIALLRSNQHPLDGTGGIPTSFVRQISGPNTFAETVEYAKAAQHLQHSTAPISDTRTLSQDQFTLTVLHLLESLIIHENVLTIDENSVTVSCLRVALEQLKRHDRLEESVENRLVIRHKLLGLVMLCLNNMFFLQTLESTDLNLRVVATDMIVLLKDELHERPFDALSCEFTYNLIYTIVSAVNQSFLHLCDNLVSEQLFLTIFKLLESNLDIVKHTYSFLQQGSTNEAITSSNGTVVPWTQTMSVCSSGLIEILITMLHNFIFALAPTRGSCRKTRKSRFRLHHSRQDIRNGYVCALENLLLNLFSQVKHSDQRLMVNFFKVYQLCCCNTNAHTLQVLLKLSNDELIPKLRLNFASRAIVHAIFNRSQCETCESDHAANTFYEQFTRTHREVFGEFKRAENRSRMPTFLRYLQDIVRVVPYRLRAFILQELVLKQLHRELSHFVERTDSEEQAVGGLATAGDDGWKEIVNACLSIVCRFVIKQEQRDMNLFYREENLELLRALAGRVEFTHSMQLIMTTGILDRSLSDKFVQNLVEMLFTHLDEKIVCIANIFTTISSSKVEVSLKTVEKSTAAAGKLRKIPLETMLQLHQEHWKTVRQLLKESERFREQFFRRYDGVKGVNHFLDLAYNIASVCLFRSVSNTFHEPDTLLFAGTPSALLTNHSEYLRSFEPERKSVLNIFHFNDQLIDGSLSSASLYYSVTGMDSFDQCRSSSAEEDEYSFLRELQLATINDEWQREFMFPYGQPTSSSSSSNDNKLEKKWSIAELFNIRQMLSNLMEDILGGTEQHDSIALLERRLMGLPEDARKLLVDPGNLVIKKKLTNLLETIMASMQLLMNGLPDGVAEQNIKPELANTMQVALIELKRLLLNCATKNWDCPSTANNVINVLHALLKVAEMRKESSQSSYDIRQQETDSERERSHFAKLQALEDEAEPVNGVPLYRDDETDDLSSTDESYTTAREDGYEGDVEIDPYTPTELIARKDSIVVGGLKQCPVSRLANDQICTIVTEILVELSNRCVERPEHWCPVLAQMVVKLNIVRNCLGGSLYLIRGFATVLQTSDARLKELQAAIVDLIVDFDVPEVLIKFMQLLHRKDPPVQLILTKLTNLYEAGSGVECYQCVQFPVLHADRTFSSSCDVLLAKKVTFLREHHSFFNVRTGFTDAATIVPMNCANFYPWHGNGFTVSVWVRVAQLANRQQTDFTHLLSVGSEKQMLSIYVNSQRQLVVRYSKPDVFITPTNTNQYLGKAIGRTECCDNCAKEMQHLWMYKHLLRGLTDAVSHTFMLDTPRAQCVYCFKQLPVGQGRKESTDQGVGSSQSKRVNTTAPTDVNLRQCTIGQDWCVPEGCWSMLTFAVQQNDDIVQLTVTYDGVQQLAQLSLPNPCKIHIDTDLTVLTVGHRASEPNECSVGYGLSGVHVFSRCITDEAVLANLYAIGPNVTNFVAFATGHMIPNYGTLNLPKLSINDLRMVSSVQLLERTHVGYLFPNKMDSFVSRHQAIGVMSFAGKIRAMEIESLQRSLAIAGGVSVMLIFFARVVEITDTPTLHVAALKLLLRVAHCNQDFFNEFVQCNYLELIGVVLKSKKCHKDVALLTALLELAFDQPIVAKRGDQYRVLTSSSARIRYPGMITFLLENFQIWIDQSEEVLDLLLSTLATATRDKHPGMMYNCQRLQDASLVSALIDFCRVNFVIPAKTVKISRKAADLLVSLIAILSATPPKVTLLNEIMELLLLMHKPTDSYVTHDRQKFYFNISPNQFGGGGAKRSDRTVTSSSGASSGPTTPKMQLRDRRLRPQSQLRKILPLTIASGGNSSFESATTSFIIEPSPTNAASSTGTGGEKHRSPTTNAPKSPKLLNSPDGGIGTEECYEKLNAAIAEGKLRRKSLLDSIDKRGNGKRKLRRLKSTPNIRASSGGRKKQTGSPRLANGSPRACPRNDLNRISSSSSSGQQQSQSAPTSSSSSATSAAVRYKFFEQNYFATGNDFLQESFLRIMCDFLLILPDRDACMFLSGENRILETMLILANNGNIRIRTMLLNLVAVIDDRIDGARAAAGSPTGSALMSQSGGGLILQQYSEEQSKVFWYHLANQIGTHSVNAELLDSCIRWITKSNILFVLAVDRLVDIRANGLNVLIAILIQAHVDAKLFRRVLAVIENMCTKHRRRAGQHMIDNGLVWALVKTAVKMNEKEELVQEESRTYLLEFLTSFSHLMILSNVANPFWDLLNGLTVAQKHKNERVTKAVRDLHASLLRNVLQIFIFRPKQSIIGNKNTSFTVELARCSLSKAEVKTRFNRLHDKAIQFVTNSDPEGDLSDAEMALIRHLMNRTLNGNPRGGNIILWCLLPKRPIRLKIYTIKQLGQYLECGGNHLSAICDVKMLKVFVQSILLLNQKHIPLEDLRLVNTFYQSIDGGLAHGASWNLTQTLKDFEYLRTISMNDQEQTILKSIGRQEKLIYSCTVAAMQITRNSVEKQNRLRKELIIQLRKDNDYRFYDQWHQLVGRMTHEDAPWYSARHYPNSWELDDTYGPDMALKRMRRCPMTVDRRFLMKESLPEGFVEEANEREQTPLLGYLFSNDYRHEYSVEDQVLYTFTVRKTTPSHELECECIITSTELVLKPYEAGELEIYDLHDITKIWTKRYEHQESAVEVFLKCGKSLFIVFDRDPSERDTFEGFFHDLVVRCGRQELDQHTQQWREGALSNWEYLMLLNQISGRTFHDLMQYPVFPWVLANYDTRTLDLLAERSFRVLEKPIAVQHRELEKHYINNYNHLRQAESGDPNGGRRKIQPYHYSSHYSNSGTVLHFLVRVLPFTSLFLQYQDDSFDIPDRTFHSLQTTWNLASKDSPTDVKELIPEFFTFPEFLENQEGFEFGVRQSGEPVNHVELPAWCNGSARVFVLIHRQALEANIVRRQLSHWIDLIFGYKQTGQAAIDAINVFHPATYCDFTAADIDDPVMKLALETMVKTYGQMPRRLFDTAHPPPAMNPLTANPPKVLESVVGLRWGLYCGSPILSDPKLVDVWEKTTKEPLGTIGGERTTLPPASLVTLDGQRVFVLPEKMNVFVATAQTTGTKKHYTISWGETDDRLRIRVLQDGSSGPGERPRELFYGSSSNAYDPITACGTDPHCTSIFFGHRSGRIVVFQQRSRRRRVSFFNQNMQPAVTMMSRSRSSSFRRWIDRKSANLRRRLEMDPDEQQQQQHQTQQDQRLSHDDQMEWTYPIQLLKHRAPISAIRVSMEYKIVVSVSVDGCAAIWDANSLMYVREIPRPVNMLHSMISQIAISPTLGDIVLVHSANTAGTDHSVGGHQSWSSATLVEEDDSFEVTENYNADYVNITMATNRRDQLRLYTVNAQYVEHVFVESPIQAITYSSIKEGCGVNCIVVALESGIVRFYSSWNLALLREVNVEPNGVKCALFSKYQHLLLLTANNTVQSWTAEGLPGVLPTIQEPYQCGV